MKKKNEDKIYIKNEKIFKNTLQMIIYCLLFCIIIFAFIYISKIDFNTKKDAKSELVEIFDKLDVDNVFVYGNAITVRNLVENGNGIVLFGTNNEWVNYYISFVNRAAKEMGIKEIYYYDFIKNKVDNNGTYESIVNKLEEYVIKNDRGFTNIYAPTLLVMKNGKVLLFDDETSFVRAHENPSSYWTYYMQMNKIEMFKTAFLRYLEG